MPFTHHYNIQSTFTALEVLRALPIHPSLPPPERSATTDLFTIFIVLPFPECHIVGIAQYVAFLDWLLSLSNMLSSFLHVFLWLDRSFLFIAEEYSIVCMCHSFFLHPPTEGHFGCFQVLAIINKAVVNIHVQGFVLT